MPVSLWLGSAGGGGGAAVGEPAGEGVEGGGAVDVVEDEVVAVGEEDLLAVGGGDGVEEALDLIWRGEWVVRGVEDERGDVDACGGGGAAAHEDIDLAEESEGEVFDVMGGVLHLAAVGGIAGDLDLAVAEFFEGDALIGEDVEETAEEEIADGRGTESVAEGDDGGGEDDAGDGRGVVRGVVVFGVACGVDGDEGAETFAEPEEREIGVFAADEGGEVAEVFAPLAVGIDVAAAARVGVVALAAELHAVEGEAEGREVFAGWPEVAGCAAEPVDADDDPALGSGGGRGPLGEGEFLAVAAGPAVVSGVHGEAWETWACWVEARGGALAAEEGGQQTEKETHRCDGGHAVGGEQSWGERGEGISLRFYGSRRGG